MVKMIFLEQEIKVMYETGQGFDNPVEAIELACIGCDQLVTELSPSAYKHLYDFAGRIIESTPVR